MKHPKPTERSCEREGCTVRFTPEAYSVARGGGRFCSKECCDIAQRNHIDVHGVRLTYADIATICAITPSAAKGRMSSHAGDLTALLKPNHRQRERS